MTQVVTGAWVPTDQTFGARLALIRQCMGWGNVAEAAKACGIAVETWRYWESKTAADLPRKAVERAQAIADRTGVDFYWLLTGQNPGGTEVRHQGLEPRTRWFGARRARPRLLAAVHGRRALIRAA